MGEDIDFEAIFSATKWNFFLQHIIYFINVLYINYQKCQTNGTVIYYS